MRNTRILAGVAGIFVLGLSYVESAEPRHVIVMISDGTSFNTWRMASLYEGKVGKQPYEQDSFVRFPCTTYPLNTNGAPSGGQTLAPGIGYVPEKAWDAKPIDTTAAASTSSKVPADTFVGYSYLKSNYTDSAAAATALATGVKTYNNAINWGNDPAKAGSPLRCISEYARDTGRSAGVVTSVPFPHATPAGFGAHNISRNNYHEIAREMLTSGVLSVIMGAGNPDFDNNGKPKTQVKYDYTDAATWEKVRQAHIERSPYNGYSVAITLSDFQSLATAAKPPARVFGVAPVESTLQQARAGYQSDAQPFAVPNNADVPDLPTMARGALNVLSQDPDGFCLMIEGGAVDWAAHGNQTSRAIEELVDFNHAVQAVIDFVDKPGDSIDWNNTLLVITTDHGNSLPLGPDSVTSFFAPLQDNGLGKMPGVLWHHNSHTNELVPVFARGMGSELFATLTHGQDLQYRAMYQLDDRWPDRYIDNTDVFRVCKYVLTGEAPQGVTP